MRTLASLTYKECAPVVTAEAMRFLDNDTKRSRVSSPGFQSLWGSQPEPSTPNSDEYSTPIDAGYALMKLAGKALFNRVAEFLGDNREGKSVAIIVGGGNNGGDGLALANLLISAGIPSTVYSLAKAESFKDEAALAYQEFASNGGELIYIVDQLPEKPEFSLIVDCMLGNGASGELRPAFARAVIAMSDWGIPILSADAPTGFDSTEHRSGIPCTEATETILFGLPRLDAFTQEGAKVFGNVTVEPLDYPENLIDKVNSGVFLATEKIIPALLPDRDEFGDKRTQGAAMIIAGSGNMTGAAALCSKATLRSGAGLVTIATPKALLPALQAKLDEPVFCGIGVDGTDKLSIMHLMQLQDAAQHQNAIAIGPGLGTETETQDAIRMFLTGLTTPVVVDADAINACGSAFFCMDGGPTNAIITPHKREWERNFGPLPSNESFYPEYLQQFATQFKITIVLKGCPTYIAIPDGRIYIVAARNSGLAKGGSGDVLTGIITALLAQGVPTAEAAVLGVLLHQKAGRITREKLGAFSMLPTDVIESLPQAFGTF
jgi:NAD(P)H-hydrate epimerase